MSTPCFDPAPRKALKIVKLEPGRRGPAHSDRVAVTRIGDFEFQADGLLLSGRLRPLLYDPGTNFPTELQALKAVLRWAERNGAEIVYLEPLISA